MHEALFKLCFSINTLVLKPTLLLHFAPKDNLSPPAITHPEYHTKPRRGKSAAPVLVDRGRLTAFHEPASDLQMNDLQLATLKDLNTALFATGGRGGGRGVCEKEGN